MLFSGIVDIVIFARGRDRMVGSVWFLVDGILTVLLSLFVLFDQAFTALSLPFIFGMWLLFSGVSKFVNSFDLRRLGVRGWGWFTALGVLLAFGGFFSFLDPVAGALTLSILAGALLILQGLSSILRACFSGRFLLYAPLQSARTDVCQSGRFFFYGKAQNIRPSDNSIPTRRWRAREAVLV